jgi:hypothetical protein
MTIREEITMNRPSVQRLIGLLALGLICAALAQAQPLDLFDTIGPDEYLAGDPPPGVSAVYPVTVPDATVGDFDPFETCDMGHAFRNYAYHWAAVNCVKRYSTLAHEVGHNLGAEHEPEHTQVYFPASRASFLIGTADFISLPVFTLTDLLIFDLRSQVSRQPSSMKHGSPGLGQAKHERV